MQTAVLEARSTIAKPAAKKRSAPLDPQVADRLLDLLSNDDRFRRLFKNDPRAALKEAGFDESMAGSSPAGCFFGIGKLASKSAIAASRNAIRTMLTSGLSQNPIQLDAMNAGTRLRQK